MLKLSVIGTGYLGATHAAAMSSLGFEVVGVDVDPTKIELLKKGKVPFYEPGLEELLNSAGFYKKREWVGLTIHEAIDFYDKYTDRAELINAIDKFLEEKNT